MYEIQTTEFLKRACDFSKRASAKKQTFLLMPIVIGNNSMPNIKDTIEGRHSSKI